MVTADVNESLVADARRFWLAAHSRRRGGWEFLFAAWLEPLRRSDVLTLKY